jgi:hypothetical protein
VKYVQDMPISWFESFIRSLAHGQIELHRALPKAESLKDCKCYYVRVSCDLVCGCVRCDVYVWWVRQSSSLWVLLPGMLAM